MKAARFADSHALTVELVDDWRADAACRSEDPELFFPLSMLSLDGQAQAEHAKSVCRRCVSVDSCLQWALEHKERGIWGATSEAERDAMTRRQKRKAAAP